jgi:UDP-N-acetylglucosamine 2-epimerase (non-hydrolysing)/GDP/UDP-N,N'-diacetylbacillosamine 2-epimerase (hydrolysing)
LRRVALVSERRADYSRFKPVLLEIQKDPELDYVLFVTGSHLLRKYGHTVDKIRADGFRIEAELPMYEEKYEDTGAEMARGLGRVLMRISEELETTRPDIVLAGFDLGSNLAIAMAGAHMNIPVAHIQGGEVTGSIDECLRHATTRFAHVHLPSSDDAVERLIKMGENPEHVFKVGDPSLDLLLNAPAIPREQVVREFDLDPCRPYAIAIQHPVTTEVEDSGSQIRNTINALGQTNLQALFIFPNTDAGNKRIIEEIQSRGGTWTTGLEPEVYANVLRHAAVLIGNSSSGIHEAASFRVPVVNIGTRQEGRLRPENVIDVGYSERDILEGTRKAISGSFREKLTGNNPYGDGKAAPRIVGVLKTLKITRELLQKKLAY